ncbi:MAG: serine O-acetyltransferase [Clostridiales bacterium]|jgi:serine O-acetyltransferase|nr:serine O-acetyltransferase [Clostridiales bacterium]
MRDVIKGIRERDPASRGLIEVFLYSGFWAVFFHRIAHALYKIKLLFLARFVSQVARFFTGVEIHPGAVIGKGLFIDHGMGVVIGETCEIGDNVTIYQGVTLGGTGKDTGKRHPTIGNNVLIGSGAKILGPFKVGDNSRVGAGSVILREVPENCTVVGVPGQIVKADTGKEHVDQLDQVKISNPVVSEIEELKERVAFLEEKLASVLKTFVLGEPVIQTPILKNGADEGE